MGGITERANYPKQKEGRSKYEEVR